MTGRTADIPAATVAVSGPAPVSVSDSATVSEDPNEGEHRDVSVVPADVLPGGALAAEERVAGAAELGPRARLWPSLVAVYRAQLSRARVARIPLLFVATFQSIGIMILMRGSWTAAARRRPWSPAPRCWSWPSSR